MNSSVSPQPSLLPTRILGILVAILCTCGVTFAAEFSSLKIGIQGKGKVGKWLPIYATAADLQPGEKVELRAAFADPVGDTCIEITDYGVVAQDGSVRLSGVFHIGRLNGVGTVSIVSAVTGSKLVHQSVEHGTDVSADTVKSAVQTTLKLHRLNVQTVLTFGDVTGIEELIRNAATYASGGDLFLDSFRLESILDLPDVASALDSVDLILITDSFETSERQAKAVQTWARSGGRLIISAAKDIEAFTTSALGKWTVPLFDISSKPVAVRDLTSMQSIVSGASRLETNRATWPMAVMKSDQTSFEAVSLTGPIMGTQSVDAGTVTFVAVDLNRKPVSQWRSLPQFYEVLVLGKKLSRQSSEIARTSRISQSGVSDIATQLLAGVDASHPTQTWSTWGIMGIIAGLLVLIGPVDYFLVTHLLKRPHLTWVSFPLMIVGSAVGITIAADSGTTQSVSQVHVVDIHADAGSQRAHSRSWMSLSTPQTMRLNLSATPGMGFPVEDSANLTLSWCGRPEDVYGGMYRTGGIGLGRQQYLHDQQRPGTLANVPVLAKGARCLYAEYQHAIPNTTVPSELSVSGLGLLAGTFSHTLPGPVSDWALIHGNRVYRVPESSDLAVLEPGEIWNAGVEDVIAMDLKAYLTGSQIVPENPTSRRGASQVVTPYNSASTDAKYIITMASLYEAAGGAGYVRLSQTLMKTMDLSDTVRLNHALLIGNIDAPAASMQIENDAINSSHSRTVLRVLLPIERQPAKSMADTKEDIEKRKRKD